jgi:hypothetical protein
MERKTYAYDCRAIRNCFVAVYINIKDKKDILKFEVSEERNDIEKYSKFLDEVKKYHYLVSFNGMEHGTQIAMHIKKTSNYWRNNEEIARDIYEFSYNNKESKKNKGYCIYRKNSSPFRELDLSAINNYNNASKHATLKWVQYNMDWNNLDDIVKSTTSHTGFRLNTRERLLLILNCVSDCKSIIKLLSLNMELVQARIDLSAKLNLPLHSLSEPKLVKKVMLELLSKDMGIGSWELVKMQTYRKVIPLRKIILPYISFITQPLKDTLSKFNSLNLDGERLKGSFKHKVAYRGLDLSFALGGIHGAKRGAYKEEKGMIIKSFDAKSFYPLLIIRNNWSPAHIPADIFCKRLLWFYHERIKYAKDDPLNYFYKIVLNAGFGLSNDKRSFIKDSLLTMQTTCNGQLLLVQLVEELCERIPGARPVMVNTDGGELVFPKEHEGLYNELCAKWQDMTKLELEHENYRKLIIWDVNNYIGILHPYKIEEKKALDMFANTYPKPLISKKGGKFYHYPIKLKGRFEVDKDLHKNKSYRIKAVAIYNYFVHGIDPKKTVASCKNIYDFCAGVRSKGEDWSIVETDENGDDSPSLDTVRYYMSKKGCKIRRRQHKIVLKDYDVVDKKGKVQYSHKKGEAIIKHIKVEASKSMEKTAIRIDVRKKFEEYDIDFDYYLKIIQKEIETVEPFITSKN